MDASANFPVSPFADYAGPPPVLVTATSDQARARAIATVESAGYRVAAVPIEDAFHRLSIQAAASAVWIELDSDGGAPLDRLLDRVDAEAAAGRFPAIISAPAALIDPITARIYDPSVDVLLDPTMADRAAAIALALANRSRPSQLNDVASEPGAARLRQLSDEVSRIAATLARLSVGPEAGAPGQVRPDRAAGEVPPVAIDTVRKVIRARRLRSRFFDEQLFADPAWDMLLDLLQAELGQHRVPVSSLCIAAAVPATTALRWIKTMTDAGLFRRRADPHDGRRVFIELSEPASAAMRCYFAEVELAATI
jgi:DNA-binding MarR family transcriptional regulator